jgi:hypothetical protein
MIAIRFGSKTKAVCPEYSTCMDDTVCTYSHSVIKGNLRIDHRPLTKRDTTTNIGEGVDLTAPTNLSSWLNDSKGSNIDIFTQLYIISDMSLGRNPLKTGSTLLLNQLHQLSQGSVRIFYSDERRGNGLLGSKGVCHQQN